MQLQEKINEVFEYYNVQSEIDSTFGNWVVSKDGDVINVEHMYPIFTNQVQSTVVDEWVDHLTEKTWFNGSEAEDFRKSYMRVEEILHIIR